MARFMVTAQVVFTLGVAVDADTAEEAFDKVRNFKDGPTLLLKSKKAVFDLASEIRVEPDDVDAVEQVSPDDDAVDVDLT